MKPHYDRITVREPRRNEKRDLYEIFTHSAGAQWCDFFEINQDNYLDRVFGSAYAEPIGKNILAKLTAKKSVFVAECEGELSGYAISRVIQPLRVHAALLLFVPLADNFECISQALLFKAFNRAFCEGNDKFNFVFMGNENVQNRLDHIGFNVDVNLVPYHHL